MAKVGGLSATEVATPEVQEIACKVKHELERILHRRFEIFKAIVYRTQLVAGLNYFIKVQVGPNEYIHIRVFEGLPSDNNCLRLDGYQTGKTRDDPLIYF